MHVPQNQNQQRNNNNNQTYIVVSSSVFMSSFMLCRFSWLPCRCTAIMSFTPCRHAVHCSFVVFFAFCRFFFTSPCLFSCSCNVTREENTVCCLHAAHARYHVLFQFVAAYACYAAMFVARQVRCHSMFHHIAARFQNGFTIATPYAPLPCYDVRCYGHGRRCCHR